MKYILVDERLKEQLGQYLWPINYKSKQFIAFLHLCIPLMLSSNCFILRIFRLPDGNL